MTNGDDSIGIKSPASNVLIENSTVRQGNGLVVGTSANCSITNITFRNCSAMDTTFGCHIKFREGQTGSASNITFEDIDIYQSERATWHRILHGDWAGYAIGIHQQNQGRRLLAGSDTLASSGHVSVANITYRDIRANVLHAGQFECHGDLPCTGMLLENVRINASRSGCTFQNVHGASANVYPTSCSPPT